MSTGKMDYIRQHKIHTLFEQLAGTLLSTKPEQPIPFLIEELKRLMVAPVTPQQPQPSLPLQPKGKYKITLAMFGLDLAGKTTLISALSGEVDRNVAPTVGFTPNRFQGDAWDLMMFDLGGGARFRGVWKEYYSELHGIIFVIDSADAARFDEAKDALWGILHDERATDKPLLIFANKQDKADARTAGEIESVLDIKSVPRHHVFGCSAMAEPVDPNIEKGLEWVLNEVTVSFLELSERIKKQLAEDKARRAREFEAQKERVKGYQADWAKEEAEKNKQKQGAS